MSQYIKIESIDQLNELTEDNPYGVECFVLLNGGLRSSKTIHRDGEKYDVFNEIDETWQKRLTVHQLKEETNIIKALEVGALYKY